MKKFLQQHQNKIEFALLFLPSLILAIAWIDARASDLTLIEIDNIVAIAGVESKDYRISIGREYKEIISWFIPFILWKIYSKYLLK